MKNLSIDMTEIFYCISRLNEQVIEKAMQMNLIL